MAGKADISPIAVVTGAAGGIGAAIARRLAAAGYRIWITAEVDPRDTATWLKQQGKFGGAEVRDFTHAGSAHDFIEVIAAREGRIDTLVNVAGITFDKVIEESSQLDFDTILSVNLNAPWSAVKACVPVMKMRGGGVIINISSTHARISASGNSLYAASKAGLSMLTRQLAVELARYNIRVNAIEPGLIAVPRNAWLTEREDLSVGIPLGRAGLPTEVANLAAWLASDEASYTTGAVIPVDGGLAAKLVITAEP